MSEISTVECYAIREKLEEAERLILDHLGDNSKRDSWDALDKAKVLIWNAMEKVDAA